MEVRLLGETHRTGEALDDAAFSQLRLQQLSIYPDVEIRFLLAIGLDQLRNPASFHNVPAKLSE